MARKTWSLATAGVVVALLGALALPSAAFATKADGDTRTTPPTTAHVYGIPLTDLATGIDCYGLNTGYGGWNKRTLVAVNENDTVADTYTSEAHNRSVFRISEPCYYPAGATANNTSRLKIGWNFTFAAYTGMRQAGVLVGGAASGFGYATCATTQWSLAGTHVTRAATSSGWESANPTSNPNGYQFEQMANQPFTAGSCAYLVKLNYSVCHVLPDAVPNPTKVCEIWEWTAERWWQDTEYTGNDGRGFETEVLCNSGEILQAQICVDVDPNGLVDGTDFDVACEGAPVPEWLSFDWLPATIAHYGRCMWEPLNGWDPGDKIGSAVEDSSVGDLVEEVEALPAGWSISESCGVIGGGDIPYIGTLAVNTCDWSWAGTVKTLLGWALVIGFAWWAIGYVGSLYSGIVGLRSPLFSESKNEDDD